MSSAPPTVAAFERPTAERPADVTLLLEGTYPFVRGGVSSWVHQIIAGLPELRFSLVFLGSTRESYGERQYELPPNVVHLESHYIMDTVGRSSPRRRRGNARAFAELPRLLSYFKNPEESLDAEVMRRMIAALGTPRGVSRDDFLHGELAWRHIRAAYLQYCTDPSFIDYFWTVRTMHAPLFRLAEIARGVPPSRVFHSISTGYAGFLGMLLRNAHGRPLVLSEHGIYTKERKIDLGQADWIADSSEPLARNTSTGIGYLRRLWIRFFEGLGRLTYDAADPIVSLYDDNRKRQIRDGASPRRTIVIPNGIDLDRFSRLRRPPSRHVPPVLGLIGRVVPIKDIKTFVRMMRALCSRLPEAEGWIIGPTDEDKDYARECRDLVASLGLTESVKFLGFQKVEHIMPRLGLVTLTSISEALPLVILEGFAAGLPALATDVGSCRELIEGNSIEDRALGRAGAVAPIASAEEMAAQALELLTEPQLWCSAQRAGIARVERYYTLEMMLERYRELYVEALARAPASDATPAKRRRRRQA